MPTVLLLIVGGGFFIFSAKFWEKTMKGPFNGVPVGGVDVRKIDSRLELPDRHLLEVSNAYTNTGGDDWPLVVLKKPNGEAIWGRVLQPTGEYPDAGTNDTPFVRDVKLLKWRKGPGEIKVIFSCYWGAGGAEKGIIYLDRDSLAFKRFAVSW